MTKETNALENIKKRLNELEAEILEATEALSEASDKYTEVVSGMATGTHTAKELKAASSEMQNLREQLSELQQQISIVNQVKRKTTIEQLPFLRGIKQKKREAAQKAYDEHAKRVQAKRNAFLLELAETPKYLAVVDALNNELADAIEGIEDVTELPHEIVKLITIPPVGESGATSLGVSENDQILIRNGNVPNWVRE